MREGVRIRKATVAVFMFNRPELLEKTLWSVWSQDPGKLLVFCDGPRSGFETDATAIQKCKELVTQIPWNCTVETDYVDTNLGLERRFSTALMALKARGEPFVVIEDDCVPGDGFLDFCEEMLERYKSDSRIGMVQGGNLVPKWLRGTTLSSYRFSRRPKIWGWASWPRALEGFDISMPGWRDCDKRAFLRARGFGFWEISSWIRKFDSAGFVGTWDYQWVYHLLKSGFLSITPQANLIENIGFGETATHTKIAWPSATKASETLSFPIRHPDQVLESRFQDRIEPITAAFSNFIFAAKSPHVWRAVLRLIKSRLAKGYSRGS